LLGAYQWHKTLTDWSRYEGRIRFKSSKRDAIVTEMIFYKIPTYFGRLQLAQSIGTLTIPCQEALNSNNTSTVPPSNFRLVQRFTAFNHFNFNIIDRCRIILFYIARLLYTLLFSMRNLELESDPHSVNKSWIGLDNLGYYPLWAHPG